MLFFTVGKCENDSSHKVHSMLTVLFGMNPTLSCYNEQCPGLVNYLKISFTCSSLMKKRGDNLFKKLN